jgi:DNA-binding transcriptional regulator YhcF (GntR family)
MIFHVDPSSGVPIFRQLMDQVKLNIATGALQPGDELPSIRSLSVPLGVNPMTISKAYNLLVHDGVLERRPGLPLVVAKVDDQQIADSRTEQVKKSLNETINLVRALDYEHAAAVDIFRELLRELGEEH